VGASNNVILRLCDAVDQPSANMCANLCPGIYVWSVNSTVTKHSVLGRSLCLKRHVRARGSTLWRHRWQEATEFLCTKTPLLEGDELPKKWPMNPRKVFSDALLMSRFQNFAADAAKKETAFFETALRAVLINLLIGINSGPKILRICFLHWRKSGTMRTCEEIERGTSAYRASKLGPVER